MDRTIHQSTVTGNSLRVRRRSVATLASVAALCLFLSACSSSGSAATSSGSTSGSGGTAAGLTTPAGRRSVSRRRHQIPQSGPALDASKIAALKGKTILFVPISLAAGPFQQQLASLKTAFGHLGINVTTCDPKFLPSAAATCLTNAKANGAAAVSLRASLRSCG